MRRMLVMAAVLAVVGVAGAAEAGHVCAQGVPIHALPSADVIDVGFAVEGKITAYDLAARTISANGITFSVPANLLIATLDPDGPGNISLAGLVDPALEAVRTIIGGTVIAEGTFQVAGTGTELCLVSVATAVYVEMAENVIDGPLISVEGNAVNVNGAIVMANTDPRWSARLVDAGGNVYPLSRLPELIGQPLSVTGYFEKDVLRATLIEFDAVLPGEGVDVVVISRAEVKGNGVRVRGSVSINPTTGAFVPSVTVFGGSLAAGGGCVGTLLGTVGVNLVDGSFDFRTRAGGAPATVCVASPGGGAAQLDVTR